MSQITKMSNLGKIKIFSAVFLAIFVFLQISTAEANSLFTEPYPEWRYMRTIELPQILEKQFVELSFDEDVFANAAPGLRDIRVYRDGEIPYKLVVERTVPQLTQRAGRILDLSFVPDSHTSFIVDLGQAGLFHNQAEIHSTSLNFRREVRVEGSNDRTTWAVLQGKAIIYDYTDPAAQLRARSTRVRYPESTARYLRIRIGDVGEQPLTITGASVFFEQEVRATTVRYPVELVDREELADPRASRIIFDLGSSGLPNNNILFDAGNGNFQRDVALEGSNDRERWSVVVARDVLFSFQTPRFTGSKLSLTYPEQTYRYLRLTIFNRDDEPIPVRGVQVSGVLRKLVFEAAPGRTYALYYGNPEARYPQYDLERYFQYLETENLPQATLGTQTANPSFEEKLPPLPPFTERFPWLLPLVLGLATLLLLGFLVRLLFLVRKKFPAEQSSLPEEGKKEE